MQIEKNILLEFKGKKPILLDLYFEKNKQPKPIIIFCHGFKGYKDWGAWNLVAEAFSKAGFLFLKFNFSHNGGTLEQPIDFPDLDLLDFVFFLGVAFFGDDFLDVAFFLVDFLAMILLRN